MQEQKINAYEILLITIKNYKKLIVIPVVVGVLGFLWLTFCTRTYESVAILKSDQTIAILMQSPVVLDSIIDKNEYLKSMNKDEAREKLKNKIVINPNAKEKLINIAVQAENAESAQDLANEILNKTYYESRPRGTEKKRLEFQLEKTKERNLEASKTVKILAEKIKNYNNSSSSDVTQGYAQIVAILRESENTQIELEQKLQGLDENALLQPPTMPTRPIGNKRGLISALAVIICYFLILVLLIIKMKLNSGAYNEFVIKINEKIN